MPWSQGEWADRAHRTSSVRFPGQNEGELHENATNPHCWEPRKEMYSRLHSIHQHAPRNSVIWIVVAQDKLHVGRQPKALQAKLRIVLYEQILKDFMRVLPTFNSLSIESMLWRIAGPAERFLYHTDDAFLTPPLRPRDVFSGMFLVLRGGWLDLPVSRSGSVRAARGTCASHHLVGCLFAPHDAKPFPYQEQISCRAIAG